MRNLYRKGQFSDRIFAFCLAKSVRKADIFQTRLIFCRQKREKCSKTPTFSSIVSKIHNLFTHFSRIFAIICVEIIQVNFDRYNFLFFSFFSSLFFKNIHATAWIFLFLWISRSISAIINSDIALAYLKRSVRTLRFYFERKMNDGKQAAEAKSAETAAAAGSAATAAEPAEITKTELKNSCRISSAGVLAFRRRRSGLVPPHGLTRTLGP